MEIVVPPREGRAVKVLRGQTIRITTPKGAQAADFFAYNAENVGEWLSANHTWVTTFSVRPRAGDEFLSRFRRPMLRFAEDGAEGVHDMMIAACDQFRYEFFEGIPGIAKTVIDRSIAAACRTTPMRRLMTSHGIIRFGRMKLLECRHLDVVAGNRVERLISAVLYGCWDA